MSVPYCAISRRKNLEPSAEDLANGDYCPVCYEPISRPYFRTVRFRWRESGQVDTAQICEDCKRTYRHRYWDAAQRDWIS